MDLDRLEGGPPTDPAYEREPLRASDPDAVPQPPCRMALRRIVRLTSLDKSHDRHQAGPVQRTGPRFGKEGSLPRRHSARLHVEFPPGLRALSTTAWRRSGIPRRAWPCGAPRRARRFQGLPAAPGLGLTAAFLAGTRVGAAGVAAPFAGPTTSSEASSKYTR